MFNGTDCLKFAIPSSESIRNEYLDRRCAPEVARLLASQPTFDWTVMTELDLSSSNVVHIAGLAAATSLRSLRLANNRIGQIRNLDRLVRLETLDLSLNRLTGLGNLDRLAALRHLNVAGNRISRLCNMDGNARLETFVANDNAIADVGQISYMRRFEHLRSMNVANNAFDDGGDAFARTIAEQFPRLRYLNGRRVRRGAADEPTDEAAAAPTDEAAAFLTRYDGKRFVDHLLDGDDDGVLLSTWNAAVAEAFDTYKTRITEAALTVRRVSLNKLADRENGLLTFRVAFGRFRRQRAAECRDVIAEFDEIRDTRVKHVGNAAGKGCGGDDDCADDSWRRVPPIDADVVSVNNCPDLPESLLTVFEDELARAADRLLAINSYANRSALEMIDRYQKNVDDQLGSLFDALAVTFDGMPEIVNAYSLVMTRIVKFDVDNPHKPIRKAFMDRFENRLAILQATYKSIGRHLDKINKREEMINVDARKWAKNTIDELKQSEKERFKMVIEEIREYRECSLTSMRRLVECPNLDTE